MPVGSEWVERLCPPIVGDENPRVVSMMRASTLTRSLHTAHTCEVCAHIELPTRSKHGFRRSARMECRARAWPWAAAVSTPRCSRSSALHMKAIRLCGNRASQLAPHSMSTHYRERAATTTLTSSAPALQMRHAGHLAWNLRCPDPYRWRCGLLHPLTTERVHTAPSSFG